MKLYNSVGPNPRVVRMFLAEKGVELPLEEIDIQGRESFLENGGENFDLVPCLNDSVDHIHLFEKLIRKYL